MLESRKLYFTITRNEEPQDLLHDITVRVPRGHFMAIVGPSGCGKTTLLKTIAGLQAETSGNLLWDGRDLAEEGDLLPNEFGYVPQFSIAYEQLTVEESIENAVHLRLRRKDRRNEDEIIERVLEETGLSSIAESRVSVLSGGQRRRLGLAMELVANPDILLCDEVTSGLDPKSEEDIVGLLADLAHKDNRLVISVTHSLANLDLYDSVLVLIEGRLAFHGAPRHLAHYFSSSNPEEIYPRLAHRPADDWHQSWLKYRDSYYLKMGIEPPVIPIEEPEESEEGKEGETSEATSKAESDGDPKPAASSEETETENAGEQSASSQPEATTESNDADKDADKDGDEEEPEKERIYVAPTPGLISQTITLFIRRWRIFFRDRTQIILQLAILIGFPLLVVVFTLGEIDQIKTVPALDMTPLERAQQEIEVRESQLKAGGFVSGLIMFQVVLLTLMGSNNSAREIAGERQIFEKEKLAGLRPGAYLSSKVCYLSFLVLAQSIWMAIFVETVSNWNFPGTFLDHAIFLLMVNGAMTAICLGISALMRSADQANLLSIYLVGFQLPLSGAVLALPGIFEPLTRPFISAYWAWSGSVSSLDDAYNNAVQTVSDTHISAYAPCLFVLALHLIFGMILAYAGSRRNLWQ